MAESRSDVDGVRRRFARVTSGRSCLFLSGARYARGFRVVKTHRTSGPGQDDRSADAPEPAPGSSLPEALGRSMPPDQRPCAPTLPLAGLAREAMVGVDVDGAPRRPAERRRSQSSTPAVAGHRSPDREPQ